MASSCITATECASLLSLGCDLVSFVTNCGSSLLKPRALTSPAVVDALAEFVATGAELECLAFDDELPCRSESAVALGRAVRRSSSTVRSICIFNSKFKCSAKPRFLQMVSVAVSPRIECLELDGIVFTPQDAQLLSSAMLECTALARVEISSSELSLESAAALSDGISRSRSLETVIFDYNAVDDGSFALVMNSLRNLPGLRSLEVCSEGTSTTEALASLPLHSALESLHLYLYSQTEDKLSPIIARMSRQESALRNLNLACNRMGPAAGMELARLVERARRLKSLDIAFNTIGAKAAQAVGRAVRRSCAASMERLVISDCQLGAVGVQDMFVQMRGGCTAISSLLMDKNEAGDLGARAVSACLLGSTTLIELDMSDNEITAPGAHDLATALCTARSLRTLRLSRNVGIGPEGASAILDALALHTANPMDEVDLFECSIGDSGAEAVGRVILSRGCRRLRLGSNQIHARGVVAIVNSIGRMPAPAVEMLRIGDNPAGEAVPDIAEKLIRRNNAVVELCMGMVPMRDSDARAIADAIKGRSQPGMLKQLRVCQADFGMEGLMAVREVRDWEIATQRVSVINFFQ